MPKLKFTTSTLLHTFIHSSWTYRSCRLTADVPTVDRASNRSGSTRAIALHIFRAFRRVWHASLLHKIKSYGISGQIFGLIFSFLSNRRLWMGSLHKNIQLMLVLLKVPFKAQGPTLFRIYINDLPDYTIYNITIYTNEGTLYFKCDQASDLWQQLGFVSELESNLQDTVKWDRKWLVDFNAGKTQLFLFDRSNITGVKIDVEYHWCENGWVCSSGKIIS